VPAITENGKASCIDDDILTVRLAQIVMQWRLAPDRFLKPDRKWLPRWRFQPTVRLDDAFQLLDKATPDDYEMRPGKDGGLRVRVRFGEKTGAAEDLSKPRAITYALARAHGIQFDRNSGGQDDR
jgi:hypothetical protein